MRSSYMLLLLSLALLFNACRDSDDTVYGVENIDQEIVDETDQTDETDQNSEATVEPEGIPSLLFVDIENKVLNRIDLRTLEVTELFSVPNGPSGVLAYDPSEQRIYYTDYDNNGIIQNTLDGQNPVTIAQSFDVRAMAINPDSRELYYASYSSDSVMAVSLDNYSVRTAIEGPGFNSYGNLQDMEYVNGQIYSITPVQWKESVSRASTSTNEVTRVLNYSEAGYGYGIAVEPMNEFIYFNNVEQSAIMRSDLNGDNIETVIQLDKARVYGLVVDGIVEKIYWTTWGNQLGISRLDGSGFQVFSIPGAARNLIKVYLPE
ncbi:MAG: hypothetical protein AAFW89_14535 [Bacteroidota bacterium]